MNNKKDQLIELALEGLQTDGDRHKQWYLEEILRILEPTTKQLWNKSWDEGLPR